MKRAGLGRGLDVLLPQNDNIFETVVRDIPIEDIDPNMGQPRKEFNEDALLQLSESIKAAGVLSPILVVENGSRFSIVAGERRYRASRLAGLTTVPCIVRDMTTEQQMAAALIENVQRQDLNPVEEANAIQSLMKECGYTQEQVGQKLGKSRPVIANSLRILTLPEDVLNLVASGALSAGHARVLAGLSDENQQRKLAEECVSEGYSVRKLEEIARGDGLKPAEKPMKKTPARELSPELSTLQNCMREALGLKTALTGNEKKGKIVLSYSSPEELEHLYEVIGKLL